MKERYFWLGETIPFFLKDYIIPAPTYLFINKIINLYIVITSFFLKINWLIAFDFEKKNMKYYFIVKEVVFDQNL